MTGRGRVDVWREGDGLWRWRYRDDEGVDLLSNESHLEPDQAIHAASVAYPGVPVEVLTARGAGRRKRPGLAGVVGRVLLYLLAVVAVVPAGIVLLWRKLARLLGR